jgi:hypothetical protein
VEVKELYEVRSSKMFAALENLDNNVDINGASKNIRENIKFLPKVSLGHCELKQHKLWFDEDW